MSLSSADSKRLEALLQEQNQYREEVRMFDSHLFRVILTYVTGLLAAFGWLGAQIIQRAASAMPAATSGQGMHAYGRATAEILAGLAQGPFFYLFAALPVISFLMFLYVARDWASLNERFLLLTTVGDQIAREVGDTEVFRFDRAPKSRRGVLRSAVEIVLVSVWSVAVLIASVTIVLTLQPYAVGASRKIWWWFGCAGLCSTLGVALIALIVFLTRRYGRARPAGTGATATTPNKPLHTDSAPPSR